MTKLRAERDYLHSAYTSSAVRNLPLSPQRMRIDDQRSEQNSVVDMQTELEVLNAGLEDRNAQVHEAHAAREFAEQEVRPSLPSYTVPANWKL